MIYGKLSLKDWRTARVEGETPESSFESIIFAFSFSALYITGTSFRALLPIVMQNLSRMPIWRIRTMDFPVWTVRLR